MGKAPWPLPATVTAAMATRWLRSIANHVAAEPDLDSEEGKSFYALGANVGRQLADLSVLAEDEIECVLAGLRDALNGAEPAVDVQTYMPKAAELFNAKQAEDNLSKNAAQVEFLAAAAEGVGATQTDSGLVIVSTAEGEGASPAASDTVMVHYEGKLIDGTVFDSSIARGQPIPFPLSGVIGGCTEGLQLMKESGEEGHNTSNSHHNAITWACLV